MIRDFGNKAAFDLYTYGYCKHLPNRFWSRGLFLFDIMEFSDSLDDLVKAAFPPNLRLHKLNGKRRDEFAIDIDKISGWRITFKFKKGIFFDVKVENYH